MKKIIIFTVVAIVIAMYMSVIIPSIQETKAQINRGLASMVSNGDISVEYMNQIAIDHGFDGYNDMVEYLISIGELYHIPAFTYCGEDYTYDYQETYACPGTIIYNDALEMGVITE